MEYARLAGFQPVPYVTPTHQWQTADDMFFRDRREAGRRLAALLAKYADRSDVIVLALPRGGVPVAYEVARALHAPLDVFVVRKLGLPGHEELAMGAVASGDVRVINRDVVDALGIPEELIERVAAYEHEELERRERAYRGDRPFPDLRGKTVILVDDGLATGSTMRAAVTALQQQRPARIVVAVPAASTQTCDEFRDVVDEVVCAITPEPFYAVGLWCDRLSGRERMGCICDSVRTDEGEQRTARSRDRAYGAETLGVVGESGLLHA